MSLTVIHGFCTGSPCNDLNNEVAILPAEPGGLLFQVHPETQPPAVAPSPPLEIADVVDPPLPAVANVSSPSSPYTTEPISSSTAKAANIGLSLTAIVVISSLLCVMMVTFVAKVKDL
ncbi:hypothetical protein SLEP1_g15655 [Rubroshorea leprosula]|uniref:Uncharacterized protein n=1 Tax=Rubroshorea leprosula TaxID=152421 RepID=A0AAV5ITY0_9ROSI|nr:hypothetical protein SLEP1_g15655 [Rubroshorea leprosula]